MRRVIIGVFAVAAAALMVLLVFPLASAVSSAPAGYAAAGKAFWGKFTSLWCLSCHGVNAEGGLAVRRKRQLFLVLVAVATLLLSLRLDVSKVGPATAETWPPLTATLSTTPERDADGWTISIMLENKASYDIHQVEIKGVVPPGTRLVDSWAGVAGANHGVFDGNAVGWINPLVKAKSKQGPFQYRLSTKGAPGDPRLLTWVSFLLPVPGTAASISESRGERLYRWSRGCRSCHGPAGVGGFGPPLAGTQLTLEEMLTKTQAGVGLMPMTPGLKNRSADDDARVEAIMRYLKSLPPTAERGTWAEGPGPGDPPAVVLFKSKGCAQCHEYTSPTGFLAGKAKELTPEGWVKQVRTPRRDMPAFTPGQVSDEEVHTINEYFRHLGASAQ